MQRFFSVVHAVPCSCCYRPGSLVWLMHFQEGKLFSVVGHNRLLKIHLLDLGLFVMPCHPKLGFKNNKRLDGHMCTLHVLHKGSDFTVTIESHCNETYWKFAWSGWGLPVFCSAYRETVLVIVNEFSSQGVWLKIVQNLACVSTTSSVDWKAALHGRLCGEYLGILGFSAAATWACRLCTRKCNTYLSCSAFPKVVLFSLCMVSLLHAGLILGIILCPAI